jgi:hypothetical protein
MHQPYLQPKTVDTSQYAARIKGESITAAPKEVRWMGCARMFQDAGKQLVQKPTKVGWQFSFVEVFIIAGEIVGQWGGLVV